MKKLRYIRIMVRTLATAAMSALMLWYAPGELLMSEVNMSHTDISYVMAAEEMNATGVVNNDKLNVRSGPSTSDDVIGQLEDGDSVDITGKDGDWYRIEYDEEVGYVSSKYVEIQTGDSESEDAEADDENDNDNESSDKADEEGDKKGGLSGTNVTTTAIVAAVILLLVIIIFATIKSIRNLSDDDEDYYGDEYEDEYDEYEEDEYEDDEYEDDEEDYEDDGEEYEDDDEYYEDDYVEEPIRRPETKTDNYEDVPPALKAVRDGADPAKYMSDNPEDYKIDIDPSYFEKTAALPPIDDDLIEDEDAPKPIGPVPSSESIDLSDPKIDKEVRIEEALKKMEELKAEIESIKNEQT